MKKLLAVALVSIIAAQLSAQASQAGRDPKGAALVRGNAPGEWRFWGGGGWGTRYSALDQINASNFNTLKVAWEWNGEVPPDVTLGDINARSLPIYVDGMLLTTSGERRTVVSLDPATILPTPGAPATSCTTVTRVRPFGCASIS